MDIATQNEYIGFMKKQLADMAKKVKQNYSKNQLKRENNVFLIFTDSNAKKYMGMGRSLDSQLGTRLQKIAFFLARRKYGDKNVPNIIVLSEQGNSIKFSAISYGISLGMTQKVFFCNDDPLSKVPKTVLNKYAKKANSIIRADYVIPTTPSIIKQIKDEFDDRDEKNNGIPLDLFFYENDSKNLSIIKKICCYEIKAGGNLDTKNAPSNAAEVKSNEKIFSFCTNAFSKFATCYDGKGDGTPDGSIGSKLRADQIVIGECFWNEILEPGVSYNDFIDLYKKAYEIAEVEKKLVG